MASCTGNGIFGSVNPNGIRFYQNSLVATEGSNQVQNMLLSGVFAPYEQLLRSRITLKAGECKYLLNHLGLGDNATFLAIVATYDEKSKIEAQNFVQYSYYTSPNNWHSFAQMLLLTGNSENRIEQLYLTNPNPNYKVTLDVLVGIIDDDSGFFNNLCDCDEDAANGIIKFSNLRCDDIITWIPDETIAILNPGGVAQAYINIADINSIERSANVLTINDRSVGTIILEFVDEYHARQALSIFSWVLEDPSRIIQDLDPRKDDVEPCIVFTANVFPAGSSPSPSPALFTPGTTSSNWNDCPPEAQDIVNPIYTPSPGDPLTSKDGDNFEALPLSLAAHSNLISRSIVGNHIVDCVIDYRDGQISITEDNIIITDAVGNIYQFIVTAGEYIIKFDIDDIAENAISDDLNVTIEILD
ncbi:MAG: hypothetical protein SLAVMIC_00119 [uncultured marine phage]|uniref:Uncharacterized protein n=1 Tax=uncultured marine phage TaxID=707152 RepID=A0A8D9FRA6_9VIRU|nr:MAG: hypothetical protein SLAVMIC_00119 [uncultured marine phage]